MICIKQLPRGANKGGLFHDKCPTLTSNSFEPNNHVLQIKNENIQKMVLSYFVILVEVNGIKRMKRTEEYTLKMERCKQFKQCREGINTLKSYCNTIE